MKLLLAIALLASMSFANTVGDETIGTVPVTIHRQIAGSPGELISITGSRISILASTDQYGTGFDAPGTEDAVAPPESVTYSYPSGAGIIVVTVYPQPGETDDGVTIRLARRVNAMQKSFPPNQPAGN